MFPAALTTDAVPCESSFCRTPHSLTQLDDRTCALGKLLYSRCSAASLLSISSVAVVVPGDSAADAAGAGGLEVGAGVDQLREGDVRRRRRSNRRSARRSRSEARSACRSRPPGRSRSRRRRRLDRRGCTRRTRIVTACRHMLGVGEQAAAPPVAGRGVASQRRVLHPGRAASQLRPRAASFPPAASRLPPVRCIGKGPNAGRSVAARSEPTPSPNATSPRNLMSRHRSTYSADGQASCQGDDDAGARAGAVQWCFASDLSRCAA